MNCFSLRVLHVSWLLPLACHVLVSGSVVVGMSTLVQVSLKTRCLAGWGSHESVMTLESKGLQLILLDIANQRPQTDRIPEGWKHLFVLV